MDAKKLHLKGVVAVPKLKLGRARIVTDSQ